MLAAAITPARRSIIVESRMIETPDLDGWSYATAAGFGREV